MIAKRFRGQVVLITGASRGIGRAIAFELAREGAKLVLTGLGSDAEMLRSSAERCSPMTEVAVFELDVRDIDRAKEVAAQATERFGPIDVLVNNAGVATIGRFNKVSPEKMRAMIDVNVFGTINMTHAVLPGMLGRGRGKIVNVASILGRRGIPMVAVYASSKAAIVALGETLRAELHNSGVEVITVLPSGANTEMVKPMARAMGAKGKLPEAEDVARLVIDAAAGHKPEVYQDALSHVVVFFDRLAPTLFGAMLARVPLLRDVL